MVWEHIIGRRNGMLTQSTRVEKYRPNTLDDVSGHQDILATINKFVDTNVCCPNASNELQKLTGWRIAITTSSPLRASWNGQDIHDPRARTEDIRQQEHAPDGPRAQCER